MAPAIIIFVAAAIVRTAFLVWRGVLLTPDSHSYLTLAHNLISHAGFSLDTMAPFTPSVRWPPLYPAFIATLGGIGASYPPAVAAVQVLIDSATATILFFMLRSCVTLKWAILGSAAYVFHPAAMAAVRAILTETLFTFLLVGSIYLLSLSVRKEKLWMTGLSGLILGLATLCRPIALLLPFVLLVPLVLCRPWRWAASHFALVAVMTLLVVAPWSIRSSIVAGRFVTVVDSTMVAILFYVASRWDLDQKNEAALWPAISVENLRGGLPSGANPENQPNTTQERIDRILIKEAVQNIRANPVEYLRSRARSFPYLFMTSYDSATGFNQSLGAAFAQRAWFHLLAKLSLLILFSVLPMLLGIAGLLFSRRHITAALCGAVWLYVLLFYVPLWVEPRYWTPCVPLLLVSAVFGLSILWRRLVRNAGKSDEVESGRERFRGELNVSGDELLLGTVGRLTEIKNHRSFLRPQRCLSGQTGSKADSLSWVMVICAPS